MEFVAEIPEIVGVQHWKLQRGESDRETYVRSLRVVKIHVELG